MIENNNEEAEIMAMAAMAQASMLFQVAVKKFTENPEKTQQRFDSLLSYLRTGRIAVTPEDREIAQKVAGVLGDFQKAA